MRTYIAYGPITMDITILSYDADGVTFRIKDTGGEVTEKWLNLPESEAVRLKKLLGIASPAGASQGERKVTNTVVGEMIWLKTSRTPVVGVVRPGRNPDTIRIDTKTVKGFEIKLEDIEKREARTIYMDEVYSADEIYAQVRDAKPPRTPQEHYELADMCQALGLYQEAKGHLEICESLDDRYRERVAERLTALNQLILEKSVKEFYDEAMRAELAGYFDEALSIIEKVNQFYPEHPLVYDLIARKQSLLDKKREAIRRDVVKNYYVYHDRFIQNIATGMIADGPEIPGKLVYLKDGRTIRGGLVEENAEMLVLKMENREYRIEKSAISSIENINLNTRRKKPTLDEARAYVTDPQGGITADIRRALAKLHNITTDEVKEIWEERTKEYWVVKPGSISKEATYTSFRTVSYGPGIWLRAGGAVPQQQQGGRGGGSAGGSTAI
ncbi:MAG TPA: hypothetical protein ENN09_01785, partial [Planctomycetes bacterium]|nr:hypothetical protein [Planctomycetota bacterium]